MKESGISAKKTYYETKPANTALAGADNVFSQARKDAAPRAKTTEEAGGVIRGTSGQVWKAGKKPGKRRFTITRGAPAHSTARLSASKTVRRARSGRGVVGAGGITIKACIGYEGADGKIRAMTGMAARSSYPTGMRPRHGSGAGSIEIFFYIRKNGFFKKTRARLNELQVCNRKNPGCKPKTFVAEYAYRARKSGVRRQVLGMAVDRAGIRAIVRVMSISKDTVAFIFKKWKMESAGKLRIYSRTSGQGTWD